MHSMLNLTFVVLITIDFGKAKVHLKITLACLLCQFCMLLDNHFTIINFFYIKSDNNLFEVKHANLVLLINFFYIKFVTIDIETRNVIEVLSVL